MANAIYKWEELKVSQEFNVAKPGTGLLAPAAEKSAVFGDIPVTRAGARAAGADCRKICGLGGIPVTRAGARAAGAGRRIICGCEAYL
jgi:hypothetical protein